MMKSTLATECDLLPFRDDSQIRHSDLSIRHFSRWRLKVPVANIITCVGLAVWT